MHLDDLGSPYYWKELAGPDDTVGLTIVLPSGRARGSVTPHLGLVSDALQLPEIALAVDRICMKGRLPPMRLASMLDLDFCEGQSSGPGGEQDDNLLVVGSADVSLAAQKLLEDTQSFEHLQAGFCKPYEDAVIRSVANNRTYRYTAHPNIGLLAMYENPWSAQPRIAILVAGLLATGTLAASRLLLKYIVGAEKGNNVHNPELPLKVVNGIPREYEHVRLKPVNEYVPEMDVRNITDIKIFE